MVLAKIRVILELPFSNSFSCMTSPFKHTSYNGTENTRSLVYQMHLQVSLHDSEYSSLKAWQNVTAQCSWPILLTLVVTRYSSELWRQESR